MGHHATGIEPTHEPSHAEFRFKLFESLYARVRRIENCHHLVHLLIGHTPHPIEDFFDALRLFAQGRALGCGNGGHGLQKTTDAGFQLLSDLGMARADVQRTQQGNILTTTVRMPGRGPGFRDRGGYTLAFWQTG